MIDDCFVAPTVFVGFDSAWADNKDSPGAICSAEFDGVAFANFRPPVLVGFEQAAGFVEQARRPGVATIVAVDQPTVVPNHTGMRPVDRAAASLVSWLGGGVQPANKKKKELFGDEAPIWGFIGRIGATKDPEGARTMASGTHVIEVFPALALASLHGGFFGRLNWPRYNPARRKTFRVDHWRAVVEAVRAEATRLGLDELASWVAEEMPGEAPRKPDQDMLDSAICLSAAVRWRLGRREDSVMIGDLVYGYMVAPVSEEVRERLREASARMGVPLDCAILSSPNRSAKAAFTESDV